MDGVTIVGNLDVAELVFYIFVLFFSGLVIWLRREDRREGYPVENDASGRILPLENPISVPPAKLFRTPHGNIVPPTGGGRDPLDLPNAVRTSHWNGSPIVPTGNPLTSGVGPSSYAQRADLPDLDRMGEPRIVPMAAADGFFFSPRDPDPRGMRMAGADKIIAGDIDEVWVDRADHLIRYYAVNLRGGGRAMVPMTMCQTDKKRRAIICDAVLASQFAGSPLPASPNQITLLEEEKIMGYFGGGYLYATPGRSEPKL